MKKILLECLAVFLVVLAATLVIVHLTTERVNAKWQIEWDARDKADLEATAKAKAKERAKEDAHAKEVANVSEQAQKTIDAIGADAAADVESSRGLQRDIDALSGRLADSQTRVSSCVADASKAATEAARVLADVLKSADNRAGILAVTADQAIERGLACEASYSVISTVPDGQK